MARAVVAGLTVLLLVAVVSSSATYDSVTTYGTASVDRLAIGITSTLNTGAFGSLSFILTAAAGTVNEATFSLRSDEIAVVRVVLGCTSSVSAPNGIQAAFDMSWGVKRTGGVVSSNAFDTHEWDPSGLATIAIAANGGTGYHITATKNQASGEMACNGYYQRTIIGCYTCG